MVWTKQSNFKTTNSFLCSITCDKIVTLSLLSPYFCPQNNILVLCQALFPIKIMTRHLYRRIKCSIFNDEEVLFLHQWTSRGQKGNLAESFQTRTHNCTGTDPHRSSWYTATTEAHRFLYCVSLKVLFLFPLPFKLIKTFFLKKWVFF